MAVTIADIEAAVQRNTVQLSQSMHDMHIEVIHEIGCVKTDMASLSGLIDKKIARCQAAQIKRRRWMFRSILALATLIGTLSGGIIAYFGQTNSDPRGDRHEETRRSIPGANRPRELRIPKREFSK